MVNNKKNTNILIKRKNLRKFLKDRGITSINSEALSDLEKFIEQTTEEISEKLKEKINIQGKKTVKTEHIKEVINYFSKHNN